MLDIVEVQKLILRDSNWHVNDETSDRRAGTLEFEREIEFARPLTEQEGNFFTGWLKSVNRRGFGRSGLQGGWQSDSKVYVWHYTVAN